MKLSISPLYIGLKAQNRAEIYPLPVKVNVFIQLFGSKIDIFNNCGKFSVTLMNLILCK